MELRTHPNEKSWLKAYMLITLFFAAPVLSSCSQSSPNSTIKCERVNATDGLSYKIECQHLHADIISLPSECFYIDSYRNHEWKINSDTCRAAFRNGKIIEKIDPEKWTEPFRRDGRFHHDFLNGSNKASFRF